jgi:predicted transcriptional regulator
MFVERILDEVFPGETGASRLQQVGLFTIIFALEGRGEPVTAARISAITGQSDSQVHRQLQKLVARELIERVRAKNTRGRAWELSIKHTAKTKKLVDAIRAASAGRPPDG